MKTRKHYNEIVDNYYKDRVKAKKMFLDLGDRDRYIFIEFLEIVYWYTHKAAKTYFKTCISKDATNQAKLLRCRAKIQQRSVRLNAWSM